MVRADEEERNAIERVDAPPLPPDVPSPTVGAMVLCDSALRDQWTNKISLIGLFSNVHAPEFPCLHPSLFLYLSLGNIQQRTPLTLRLVRATESGDVEVMYQNFTASPAKPGTVVELEAAISIPRVPLDAPGEYRFKLFTAERFLAERRFTAELQSSEGTE